VILGCAGDVPTMEALAATELLRRHVPDLRTRFVNVLDLMSLFPPDTNPHGLSEARFAELFGTEVDVVFAFHGYARAMHQVLHGRPTRAASMCAASTSRAPRRPPSTWSSSTR
jgi:xylulose-5-phosphate/fructose-6-phosphate phosphoketolase